MIICPSRLYFQNHRFLATIAKDAFGELELNTDEDGLPILSRATDARARAAESRRVQIGVMGQGWDPELQLPATTDSGSGYKIDFTLVAVAPDGFLLGFVPVEVQTIDTTNNYRDGVTALRERQEVLATEAGFNWENVSKRILPQLIVKGLMLQGERLCTHGIYFVTPTPVFERIASRLGGLDRLRNIPKQPGSITFVQYSYPNQDIEPGEPLEIAPERLTTISTSDMSIAFISPQNLPPAGSYEQRLRRRLRMPEA